MKKDRTLHTPEITPEETPEYMPEITPIDQPSNLNQGPLPGTGRKPKYEDKEDYE